jgi:hypothetical protein
MQLKQLTILGSMLITISVFTACGGGSDDSPALSGDAKYAIEYKGLTFFEQDKAISSYRLTSLSDGEFNALEKNQQLLVADKLLSTLFFGYKSQELQEMINEGSFVSGVQKSLTSELNDKAWLEAEILNEEKYRRYSSNEQEAVDILARFFTAKDLDKYYFNNWIAYILTQTIMFSPSYELDSSHSPNIARVYNRIVTLLEDEGSMRYITYLHMMSEDNWRRFRSPEDNGREMLEIYTLDMDDNHVPIAAKSLQNWKLDRDNDTLVVGLNENTEELSLFNTTIINGDDFYRELAKSDSFTYGVVRRLVSFFFIDYDANAVDRVTDTIVSSNPKTWQDILKQIVFSKEYLLDSSRGKSAEELYYSLARKMDYKHRDTTFHYFKGYLEDMHQASMKYKLGKLKRVPLDTLSFASYHKMFREQVLLRRTNPDAQSDYDNWGRQGWSDSFLDNSNFTYNDEDDEGSLESLINYLFRTLIAREASTTELAMFKNHMLELDEGENVLLYQFNMFSSRDDRDRFKRNIAFVVLEYISRVDDLYMQREVK